MKDKRISFFAAAMIAAALWGFVGMCTAHAQVESLHSLDKMAIIENGRIKPLGTFAQNILKQFSGRSKFQGKQALHWLARVLFLPQQSHADKVFLVTNPEVLDSIAVERQGKARGRYSFSQLKSGLAKLRQLAFKASKIEGKERSFIENEIIALYNKLYVYQQLLASFDFLFPGPDFTITGDELLRRMQQRARARVHGDQPLTIIPARQRSQTGEEKWLSPWDSAAMMLAHPGSEIPRELLLISDFVGAYREGSQERFDSAVSAFNDFILKKGKGRIRPAAISLEVFYNRLDPFYKATFFYGFSFLFLLLSFITLKKWFYRFSFLLMSLGFLLHLFGVLARIYIRLRPPVTNLYETFIFTGIMTVLLGMILEFFKKRNIGISMGSLAGFAMLMIAGKYALEGDTMGMLVAVLDSNFWLTVHVITIILGYSGIVLSGFIGHLYILQKIFKPDKKELLKQTFQALYAIQAFGIIFTFLGTVLGGIWADQSWGRFWGWDPKENGALLILLWSAILFHARKARIIKETGMAFGTVVGVIAVALAWFGVNLLGVGLHSYGFTSGVARSLFIFIAFELLFMTLAALKLTFAKTRFAAPGKI